MNWLPWITFVAGCVIGYFVCLQRRSNPTGINVDSTERKQMMIREGHL